MTKEEIIDQLRRLRRNQLADAVTAIEDGDLDSALQEVEDADVKVKRIIANLEQL